MVTMYIGMNDKDLHKQVLADEAFYKAIARYIESCTIFEAKGLYKGELEKSLKDETAINDILWFESDWLFEMLGINPDEEENEN